MILQDFLFLIFAGLAAAFSISIVISRNPMHSALSLIVALISIAGLFLLLHAEFLAWILIVVYTGAVMVLVVFVIALLSLQKDDPIVFTSVRKWGVFLTGLFGLVFSLYIFRDPLVSFIKPRRLPAPEEWGAVHSLSVDLFTKYLLPFELASVLLTAAVIGAVVVARKDD